MPDLADAMLEVSGEMAVSVERGQVATYIPQLGGVDPGKFGMAVATNDGQLLCVGDAEEAFSIQSISKVFTLSLALGQIGEDVWKRVGREPSGNAFNSIVQLEHEKGIPRNPFINAGAIVISDMLLAGHQPRETIGSILQFVRSLVDDDTIGIDASVAASETATGFRNSALASYMRSFGNIHHASEMVLGVYFHHCAIAMNCRQLALSGRYLANAGRNPATGFSILSAERARRVNALMLTCGHYDGSGDFAFRVGIPGKSGVGGGILGVVPKVGSVAVWSPGLDSYGNSKLGTAALEKLSRIMGWSVFA